MTAPTLSNADVFSGMLRVSEVSSNAGALLVVCTVPRISDWLRSPEESQELVMTSFQRARPRLHPAAVPLSRSVLDLTLTRNPAPLAAAELLVVTQ